MSKSRSVDAEPTKEFFVRMLIATSTWTRPFSTYSTIVWTESFALLRQMKEEGKNRNTESGPDRPYEGFYAHITANEKRFDIEAIAEEYRGSWQRSSVPVGARRIRNLTLWDCLSGGKELSASMGSG